MSLHENEPIAIIGSACRFAGDATSPSKLWELLKSPRDVLSEIPPSRFSVNGFHHNDSSYHGHSNVKHSYLLSESEDVRAFDSKFFGVKPIEAKALDPQQRLLLEVAYEGLESAGLPMEDLRGSDTAVYVGLMCADYEALLFRDFQNIPTYHSVGNARSTMSNRVSYFFDWRGPSVTVDTACSSSLTAVHFAIQALRSGDSSIALACGTNLLLGPENYVTESKLKMLSPDSRSRMWDVDANGYARGDGVAVVVLKTLSQALKDGDDIECVIRQTGINQDGATGGNLITMPSASAQKALIEDTYRKAGLNPLDEKDRCQYFEAHGTGTPAGDPIEAEAIKTAFFGSSQIDTVKDSGSPLYVGSIKTVLGHTEGTAGLAAVLKASLALQNGHIPPNMLFSRLNPNVAPFYSNLEVPTSLKPWPGNLSRGQPKRASVNSFGFGGANAHAILESFENATEKHASLLTPPHSIPFIPFVFSANSERSLIDMLRSYSEYLKANESLNPRDLAWTLLQRRSALPFRMTFPGSSIEDLHGAIDARLSEENMAIVTKPRNSSAERVRILGIFTGQGAQYARMGAELIEKSTFALQIIRELESYLAMLPETDRPSWSLEAELLAGPASSRLNEAALSQPLCTAIQILLVELLRQVNVHLDVVVGHSSGEIGAAYAAGYLSARDAMYIAYYRGVHTKLAGNQIAQPGAMLAVATSIEDATDICSLPEFKGRVSVAAHNSSSSVTLSGDEDAIAELEDIFEDENKFKRRLRVDKAYHSHHMLPSSAPYIRSLRACGIQTQEPSSTCTWMSSVYEHDDEAYTSEKAAQYWADNMTRPVLFSKAVERAMSHSEYDLVLEIGPHPALKGPASQNIQEYSGQSPPYFGMLSRGTNACAAVSDAMGSLWSYLGRPAVDVVKYEEKMAGNASFSVLKNLPTYQWNHDTQYWHESRQSRGFRLRDSPVHPLLGDATPDSSPHHRSWRNLLRTKELAWVSGHQLQNQTVFPAAGYLATALEASRSLADEYDIRLIEIEDFIIHQALAFDEEDAGIETLASLTNINKNGTSNVLQANFTYAAGIGREPQHLTLIAQGTVSVHLGEPVPNLLPERGPPAPHMIAVEKERFYTSLSSIGYMYSGYFQGLSSIERKLGTAAGLVDIVPEEAGHSPFLVHPATLDSALQSIILAYSYPHDGALWSLHVPTSFSKLRINPALCGGNWLGGASSVPFSASSVSTTKPGIVGDVSIYGVDSQHAAIQLEGMTAVPFSEATVSDDKKIFSRTVWGNLHPSGEEVSFDDNITQEDEDFAYALERLSTYYTRKFDRELAADHPARSQKPFSDYLHFCQHMNTLQREGRHVYAKKEWLNDTAEDISALCLRYADTPDVRIMRAVGENMLAVFRGETTILEHLRPNNLLDEYYVGAIGFPQFSKWLARTVHQIAHRYPHLDILEIGAGTGGATKSILRKIDRSFASYTYTDISTGFFETAGTVFAQFRDRMIFKSFDAERDPVSQGFAPHSYDLIVASFVLHATSKLEEALHNVRRLLRPGGYLVLAESTNNDQVRAGFIFGTLPGWWSGVDEGRVLSPCVSAEKWDEVLRRTGFSGVDTTTPEHFERIYAGSVLVSQAVDDRLNLLREPLLSDATTSTVGLDGAQRLVILGGNTLRTSRLVTDIERSLRHRFQSVTSLKTLDDTRVGLIPPEATILSLVDLDKPVFKDIKASQFEAFKGLFESERTMLWVTKGRRADDPFSNMVIGFGRTARHENPGLRFQSLDFESQRLVDAKIIAETLVRFQLSPVSQDRSAARSLLWSTELEIIVDEEGRQLVPRQEEMVEANSRYNSARRPIVRNANLGESNVELHNSEQGVVIRDSIRVNAPPQLGEQMVELQAVHTSIYPIKTCIGHFYLILGIDKADGAKYIALTETLASSQLIPRRSTAPCDVLSSSEANFVHILASYLVSSSILRYMLPGQSILVHNATPEFARCLSQQASSKGIKTFFTADSEASSAPGEWIEIYPHMTKKDILRLIPNNVAFFLGLEEEGSSSSVQQSIISALPPHCHVETASSVFSRNASSVSSDVSLSASKILDEAIAQIQQTSNLSDALPEDMTVHLEDLATIPQPPSPWSILDWQTASPLPVQAVRLDSRPLFQADKTYWLVGLSGTLGLSLCDWMVDHGAKSIVITSRNPGKIDPAWVELKKQAGATVKLIANDITNEDDLKSVHSTIVETLPPIAGVVQGAMVLKDSAIRDMSMDDMLTVLRPRVEGSLYLDSIFQKTDLDFFIYLSSMTGVLGNAGQANYTTANTFMSSLAARRRKRGLAATVINVGVIIGAGYVTREVSNMNEKRLGRGGMMWMSESDFHQMFAEAILAGKAEWLDEPELSTGLRHVQVNSDTLPTWHDNPRFSRFIVEEAATESAKGMEKTGVSIKSRLESAETAADIYELIKETFASKLRAVTQLDMDDETLMTMRTDEIGLDSLIAVDIRSWFLKNYEVSIPVLKILGGALVSELVEQAVQDLPLELTPKIGESEQVTVTDISDPAAKDPEQPASLEASIVDSGSSESSVKLFDTTTPTGEVLTSDSDTGSISDASAALPKLELEKTSALSFSQSMFWFVHSLLEDKTILNHTGMFLMTGSLDIGRLSNAVKQVGQHHEALRTSFFYSDEDQHVQQGIVSTGTLHLEQARVSNDADVMREFEEMKAHVFDIGQGQIMRLRLLTRSPTENYFLIGCHHINVDGISQQVLLRDIETVYNGRALNAGVLQYPDYSTKQRSDFEDGKFDGDIAFWKGEFATIPEPLPLVRSHVANRRPLTHYAVNSSDLRINATLAQRIRAVCRLHKATTFHFLLTAFEVLLYRLTDATQFSIGIADGNRKEEETLSSFGPFVNLLPLNFEVKSRTFGQELSSIRAKTYSALAHSSVPFEVLLNELRVDRSPTHSPIFQAFMDYRQGTTEKLSFAGCELELLKFEPGKTAYDLSIDIIDNPSEDILISVMGQGSLYTTSDVEVIARCFEDIVIEFSENPGKRITNPWSFREDDTMRGLKLGKGIAFSPQWPGTLVHRFLDVARSRPEKGAVVTASGNLVTYRDLDIRINAIASALLGQVQPGNRVIVYQESGPDLICSMLAVLKIGAVYVPLDYKTRASRVAAVAQDCDPVVVLVDKATEPKSSHLEIPKERIVNVSTLETVSQSRDVSIRATPDSPAVCIYTSGSTGTPKGVILKHSNLSHEVEVSSDVFKLGPETVVLQQSSFNFDMSILQVLLALSIGGTVCMASEDMKGDPIALTKLISQQNVTFTCATPSEYVTWLQFGAQDELRASAWKVALSGGEAVTQNLLTQFRGCNKPDLQLFNGYGPTETTFCSSKMELEYLILDTYFGTIPAGFPSPGEAIYIVDEQMRLLPPGLAGEIVIGGACVAAGYLNQEELTKQSFLKNVFATEDHIQKGLTTMYRTKDRGRLLSDGCLLVEGRVGGDTEIKLRGMRVDLREIEQMIIKCSGGIVIEAAVSSRSQVLVGHVVFSPASVPANAESFLRNLCDNLPLPEGTSPAVLVPIERMPTTPSSKFDRVAVGKLPVQLEQSTTEASRPLTIMETRMKAVWAEVLADDLIHASAINAESDFFRIGGTSMLLIDVQARLRKQLGAAIPLVQLFGCSTLGGMTRLVEQRSEAMNDVHIDWEAETSVPFPLSQPLENALPLSVAPRTILLTGATGFLGAQLLKEMIKAPKIEKIICVAIRHLDRRLRNGEISPEQGDRVVYYEGDLQLPRLGLSEDDAADVFAHVDAVIHNGADVSHLKSYNTLRAANVGSTRELVRLCAPRAIPIHYVSTAGVAMFTDRETFGEVSVRAVPPPTDGSDGYTSSKWASERLLERVSEEIGLPVWIHRPSSIIRPEHQLERNGEAQFDLLQSLLHFSRKMRAVPISDRLRGSLDLISLENAARNITADVLTNTPRQQQLQGHEATPGVVTYVHQTGDLDIPLHEMEQYLEKESGGQARYDRLPIREWAARAESQGLHTVVAAVFTNAETLGSLAFPTFVKTKQQ
ncbi:beta-ketoacyl synthase domain-containing protein [Nemania sp. FL0916]|nr:beta-ketoacyl synthase domain-containing protein [Nemania sp. FL0916]